MHDRSKIGRLLDEAMTMRLSTQVILLLIHNQSTFLYILFAACSSIVQFYCSTTLTWKATMATSARVARSLSRLRPASQPLRAISRARPAACQVRRAGSTAATTEPLTTGKDGATNEKPNAASKATKYTSDAYASTTLPLHRTMPDEDTTDTQSSSAIPASPN